LHSGATANRRSRERGRRGAERGGGGEQSDINILQKRLLIVGPVAFESGALHFSSLCSFGAERKKGI